LTSDPNVDQGNSSIENIAKGRRQKVDDYYVVV
jgi:hypothetical protein